MFKNKEKEISLRKLLRDLYSHISQRRKIQLFLLVFSFILSSFAETLSLAVIAPYLYYIVNPMKIYEFAPINNFFVFFKINQSNSSILLILTLIVVLSSLFAGAIRLMNLWLSNKVSFGIGSDISCLSYNNILYQDYEYHLSANSNNLIATLSNDVNIVIVSILSPIIQLIASLILVLAIAISLLILSPLPTILTSTAIFFSYVFFLLNSKPKLKLNSKVQSFNNRKQIKVLQDGLGYIRNIILNNNQSFFTRTYQKYDKEFRKAQAESGLLTTYTKIILEPTVISLIVISGYYMAISGKDIEIIPALGIFALGAQKILPFTQRAYEGWASSSGAAKNLANVIELLQIKKYPKLEYFHDSKDFILKNITLKDVSFSYKKDKQILNLINLELKTGDLIGFIGKTGCGKSTLIDIINTLLIPSSGKLLVNGENIHLKNNYQKKMRYRRIISHIPQNIYLSDDSILSNIALGISEKKIDFERLEIAIECSKTNRLINSLPKKINTFIGERGIQLSGGERQRIGIARAIYHKSKILILDEATNALDKATEKEVIDSILSLPNAPLIIMIAHRLNTLKYCDYIYELKNGSLTKKWTGLEFSKEFDI